MTANKRPVCAQCKRRRVSRLRKVTCSDKCARAYLRAAADKREASAAADAAALRLLADWPK